MSPTVYMETSVVSYLTARPSRDVVVAAYQEVTREWWRRAPSRFVLYASALVIAEARTGDADAARARLHVLGTVPLLDATSEAVELTRELLAGNLIDDDGRPRYPGEWFWAAMLITTLCMLITSGWFWAHVGNEEHAYRVLNATTGENWVAITEVRNGQPVRIVGQ